MSPKTKRRAALLLIPIALVIGIVAALLGNWYSVVAMGCLIASQGLNYRANRERLD